MNGCRPLTEAEAELVRKTFAGRYAARDRCLFLLGLYTGFRISELLRVRVRDVWRHGTAVHVLSLPRRAMKGQRTGRTMAVHEQARAAIAAWLAVMPQPWDDDTPLFRSQKGGAMSRVQAWQILHDAYQANTLEGRLGTHSMRKTFAQRLYTRDHDALKVKHALGHQHLSTTEKYLAFVTQDDIFALVRSL